MIINKPRQSGKTHDLIITAHYTGYPIIVSLVSMRDFIKKQATDMGYDDVVVMGEYEWRALAINRAIKTPILVDELGYFMDKALNEYFGTDVVSATITLPMEELKNETDD